MKRALRRQEAPDAFGAFLAEAGLGRVEEPLKRCGISTLQQLRDTPAAALKAAVDADTYEAFHASLNDGSPLDKKAGNVVAQAMMDWAEERGASTVAHWFS